jgi:OmpA-OmpF porin, OOP family
MARIALAKAAARRIALATVVFALGASPGSAQIIKRLAKTVANAAQDETLSQLDRLVRDRVRCVFDDLECIGKANASGKGAVLTDDEGTILVGTDGKPVSDPDSAKAIAGQDELSLKPGEGAWANYDFQPGDSILVYEDFTGDNVGDFPRRFDLVEGSWEVVDWEGRRFLRATSGGSVAIPLPKTLPEKFTLEFSVNLNHGNAYARFTTSEAYYGTRKTFRGSVISVEATRAGLRAVGNAGPTTLANLPAKLVSDGIVPIRIMADSGHMKMYVREKRVANAPNGVFPRSDTLFLAVGWASEARPILIGPIRIAAGGRDLYDRLSRDGRVATQGVLFATNSARLRPESTPTLAEIGQMIRDHPDLRISIEGHTDSEGDDAYNQTLSEERAAAVKTYLVTTLGIAEDHLQTVGYGESRPVADNATPEGKQQNRRVELVRLPN